MLGARMGPGGTTRCVRTPQPVRLYRLIMTNA
jgi:hypothetical protein